jgi:hypothetical protein
MTILKRKHDYIGKTVKSLVDLKNGYGSLPKGTYFKVISLCGSGGQFGKGGLELESFPCKNCGLSLIISQVAYSRIEII